MTKEITHQQTLESLPGDEHFWNDLYEKLRKPVASFVRRYKIPSWEGQEDDMINDIIQETVIRIYKKFLTSPEEIFSIQNIESFSYTISQRYCLDLRRKEQRINRLSQERDKLEPRTSSLNEDDDLTRVLEAITTQSVLIDAAHLIAKIPTKQRRALLIDLARYNDFMENPTTTEQAFAAAGIQLAEYRYLLPQSQPERSRHNALVSLGYRRLRMCFQHEPENSVTLNENVNRTSVELARNERFRVKDETDRVPSHLLALIDELREPYRETLRLRYLAGYSYPEIVEHLHLPIGTVKSHLSRGRNLLDILAKQKEGEEKKGCETIQENLQKITKGEIVAHIDELREPYNAAIRLHYLEEYSYPKTAECLQLPVGTVKSLVSRGRKMLVGICRGEAIS